jgi:hypothetical protein
MPAHHSTFLPWVRRPGDSFGRKPQHRFHAGAAQHINPLIDREAGLLPPSATAPAHSWLKKRAKAWMSFLWIVVMFFCELL